MALKDYFEKNKGLGVLSTADAKGKVNAAVYSRPHVLDDGRVAFIMGDKLSHANIGANPRAVFLFKEEGSGYEGKRLYLRKDKETDDAEIIDAMAKHKCHGVSCDTAKMKKRYLVYFKVESVLPLIGSGE
ncbi:MAG: pyridoxamine 5'-phosphate oxidase family protein [Candidatus Omnitrophica bacterium]|nr:pyridoxamine 5'-phosphate oxidase family protein [Candidatus Omnitrophota bacterium]